MQRPEISVLINNHNYGRFIAKAVESALEQSEVGTEVIVIDDGSSDDSRAILEPYRDQAQVIFQDNRGQAAAVNAGVRASRGEILCFLDADDWWARGKLTAIAAAFAANSSISLVYHRLQPMLDDKPILKPIPRTLCSGELSHRLTKSAGWWPFPMTSAIAVRRRAWDAAGDIPEHFRISADAWLSAIYPFIGPVASLPETLGYYRIHNNHWYRSVDDAAMLRKRLAHWQSTVETTNQFLADWNLPDRLRLSDHYPYQLATARLNGIDTTSRLKLALKGLLFAGEPSLLRRTRDALRIAYELPGLAKPEPMSEGTP